jgi:hypothetical protein
MQIVDAQNKGTRCGAGFSRVQLESEAKSGDSLSVVDVRRSCSSFPIREGMPISLIPSPHLSIYLGLLIGLDCSMCYKLVIEECHLLAVWQKFRASCYI